MNFETGKPRQSRACPGLERMKGPSLAQALALIANIRLGWKGFPGRNTLAYYKNPLITSVKSFVTLAPGCVGLKKSSNLPVHRPKGAWTSSETGNCNVSLVLSGNTKGGSIPVPLTSCWTGLTGLE